MNLEKLHMLSDEYTELQKLLEEKRNEAKKQAIEVEKQIEELEKKLEELNELSRFNRDDDPLVIKSRKIYSQIYEERIKTNVYGIFNIKELGEVIAILASDIIGIKYKFAIMEDSELGFACINNHGIYFERMMATLTRKDNNGILSTRKACFKVASSPTIDDNISYGYGGEGRASLREFNELEEFTIYNPYKKTFVFEKIDKQDFEVLDFIKDYLVFVSNYRLGKDLKEISKLELIALKDVFLETYGSKYVKYKERQKKLEKFIQERKQREEAEKRKEEARKKETERLASDPEYAKLQSQIRRLENRKKWRRSY